MTMTPREFMEEVYEIAYGDQAYFRGFYPEEVVERLQDYNEIEKLKTSLKELSDTDLLNSRQTLIDQTNRVMEALDEIGTEE